ncbi:uncharacterized protein LOC125657912 [Ostrea edulis]|uniref:uncharacterized protein LOC125657912 n=1 Tax=Ostrea edulis TaxID=37623 RepID=UPI0020947362|nr:uncharacterized protein LOC125657912 [Ostrea edulis]
MTANGSGSTFRVELLLHSLKEIQQEKNCLESKLAERRSKRRELENLIDIENNKLSQMKEGHEKMQETMKVAQLKEAQTQSLANSIEESNQHMRENIDELNRKLIMEKQRHSDSVGNFEKQLSDIVNHLINARSFYEDSALKKVIGETEFHKTNLQSKAEVCHQDHLDLQQQLANVSACNKLRKYQDIPLEFRKEIRALFKEENAASKGLLRRKKEKLKEIEEKVASLKK